MSSKKDNEGRPHREDDDETPQTNFMYMSESNPNVLKAQLAAIETPTSARFENEIYSELQQVQSTCSMDVKLYCADVINSAEFTAAHTRPTSAPPTLFETVSQAIHENDGRKLISSIYASILNRPIINNSGEVQSELPKNRMSGSNSPPIGRARIRPIVVDSKQGDKTHIIANRVRTIPGLNTPMEAVGGIRRRRGRRARRLSDEDNENNEEKGLESGSESDSASDSDSDSDSESEGENEVQGGQQKSSNLRQNKIMIDGEKRAQIGDGMHTDHHDRHHHHDDDDDDDNEDDDDDDDDDREGHGCSGSDCDRGGHGFAHKREDKMYTGALGYGPSVDQCLHEKMALLSPGCQQSIQAVRDTRAQLWQSYVDESSNDNHFHQMHKSSFPLFLVFLTIVLIVALVRKRMHMRHHIETMRHIADVIRGDAQLKAAVEAKAGVPFPDRPQHPKWNICKSALIVIVGGVAAFIMIFISIVFTMIILGGLFPGETHVEPNVVFLVFVLVVIVETMLLAKIFRRMRRGGQFGHNDVHNNNSTSNSNNNSNNNNNNNNGSGVSWFESLSRPFSWFSFSSSTNAPPGGYSPLMRDESTHGNSNDAEMVTMRSGFAPAYAPQHNQAVPSAPTMVYVHGAAPIPGQTSAGTGAPTQGYVISQPPMMRQSMGVYPGSVTAHPVNNFQVI